jgi:hypothetical protein
MKAYNQGAYYRVACNQWDVRYFAQAWPWSGLRCNPISFTFQTSNGDLVEHTAKEDEDGPALLALSEDAMWYGAKQLKIVLPR